VGRAPTKENTSMTRSDVFILGVALALALATGAEAQDSPPMYARTRSNYRSVRAATANPTPNEFTGRSMQAAQEAAYSQARQQIQQNNEWTRNNIAESNEPYYSPFYYNPWVGVRIR
jgi:hypothetical protein